MASTGLWAGYHFGSGEVVEKKLSTVISPGWVVVHQQMTGSPRGFDPRFPQRCFLYLVYLKGAPIGEEIDILGSSPIPQGWVKILTMGTSPAERTSYNIRYRIQKQWDADYLANDDMPPVTDAPIEWDIPSMDGHRKKEGRKQGE